MLTAKPLSMWQSQVAFRKQCKSQRDEAEQSEPTSERKPENIFYIKYDTVPPKVT